jgi:hypothetical protein
MKKSTVKIDWIGELLRVSSQERLEAFIHVTAFMSDADYWDLSGVLPDCVLGEIRPFACLVNGVKSIGDSLSVVSRAPRSVKGCPLPRCLNEKRHFGVK